MRRDHVTDGGCKEGGGCHPHRHGVVGRAKEDGVERVVVAPHASVRVEDGDHLASYECKYKFDRTRGIKWCDRAEGVHGLSRAFLDKHGINPRAGLGFLRDIFDEVQRAGVILVAHNYAFDKRMVNLTAFLNGFEDLIPPDALSFCTLRGGRGRCGGAANGAV